MNKEDYNELKAVYLEHVIEFITDTGGLFPNLTLFAYQKERDEEGKPQFAIIHIPVPDAYLEDDDSKDEFIDNLLPSIYKTIKEKFNPFGMSWASETWGGKISLEEFSKIKNVDEVKITDKLLVISIETDDFDETIVYNLYTDGLSISKTGDLINTIKIKENVTLSKPIEKGGKFIGLYKKLKSNDRKN